MKRERCSSEKKYDSWNWAKKRLSAHEFHRRRKNNACVNCGEVFHRFSDCPKPNPWLLKSVVDSAIPTTRTLISKLHFAMDDSCEINLKTDYAINSIEHHLNYALLEGKLFQPRPPVVQLIPRWRLALIPHWVLKCILVKRFILGECRI